MVKVAKLASCAWAAVDVARRLSEALAAIAVPAVVIIASQVTVPLLVLTIA